MRKRLRTLIPIALIACPVLVLLPISAQEPDPVVTWQILVNQARLDEGLALYNFSTLLTIAAQRHADDVAANGFTDPGDVHLGSDGTHEQKRIAEAGYTAWSWNGGELIVDENLWSGHGTVEDAMAFFLEDPPHCANILSTIYREIGIGIATDAAGSNYYVLDFSARPNVLPIFVNDDAASTDNPQIAIRLTNEEAQPGGEGAIFMGQAIEIRISNEPEFDDLLWQPWEPLVPWTLPDTPGEHTVYVQLRDAAGRTAASADSIFLGAGTPTTATPIPPSLTPESTATPIPPSPTPKPTATPIPSSPTPEPTATPAPTATPTPEPPHIVEPSPTPHAPRPSSLAPRLTPFPTWTPLPLASPQETSSHSSLLALLAAMQGLALILGIYLALHRGRGAG